MTSFASCANGAVGSRCPAGTGPATASAQTVGGLCRFLNPMLQTGCRPATLKRLPLNSMWLTSRVETNGLASTSRPPARPASRHSNPHLVPPLLPSLNLPPCWPHRPANRLGWNTGSEPVQAAAAQFISRRKLAGAVARPCPDAKHGNPCRPPLGISRQRERPCQGRHVLLGSVCQSGKACNGIQGLSGY